MIFHRPFSLKFLSLKHATTKTFRWHESNNFNGMFQYFYGWWHVENNPKNTNEIFFHEFYFRSDSCWRLLEGLISCILRCNLSFPSFLNWFYFYLIPLNDNFFSRNVSHITVAFCETHCRRNPDQSQNINNIFTFNRCRSSQNIFFFIKTNKRHMDDLTQFH